GRARDSGTKSASTPAAWKRDRIASSTPRVPGGTRGSAYRSRTCFRDGRLSSAAAGAGVTMVKSARRPTITPARDGGRGAPPSTSEAIRLHIPVTGHRRPRRWIVHQRFIEVTIFDIDRLHHAVVVHDRAHHVGVVGDEWPTAENVPVVYAMRLI